VTDVEATTSMSRWEWDRAKNQISTVLGRARRVTWFTAAVVGLAAATTGWFLTTGVLRGSSIIYGALAGVVGGYAIRGLYVAHRVRRAVAPVRKAVVPGLVPSANEAQLASLVVNGGFLFTHRQVRADADDATVRLTVSDLADRDWPRPGFWQLLFTGPDGAYYDDGSGTMAQGSDDRDFGGGDVGDLGDVVGGGDFGGDGS
jgi:hypothetical protein